MKHVDFDMLARQLTSQVNEATDVACEELLGLVNIAPASFLAMGREGKKWLMAQGYILFIVPSGIGRVIVLQSTDNLFIGARKVAVHPTFATVVLTKLTEEEMRKELGLRDRSNP